MRYEKPQENAFAQILQCLVHKALAPFGARPTSLYETRRCGDDASLAVVVRRRNPCGPVRGGQIALDKDTISRRCTDSLPAGQRYCRRRRVRLHRIRHAAAISAAIIAAK